MPKNIEIKARLDNIEIQRNIAAQLSKSSPTIIYQEDVFFKTNSGRLKLRFFKDGTGELISYHRTDKSGPKASEYFIFKTNNPVELKKILKNSLGILQTVKKKRELFIVGRTRIRIDQVNQLGDFLELEVILKENDDQVAGKSEARELMDTLGIKDDHLIGKAYVDLLNKKIKDKK
jgi:predicted adenylyl cyclase CyaB